MKNEGVSAHGSFIGTLIKKDGTVQVVRKDNLILDGGIDAICNCISGSAQPSAFSYIAVGKGTTATAASQTALISELGRKAAVFTHTDGTGVFTVEATFNEGEATGAITEAGVCNASTGGTFLDRVVFDVINKGEEDIYTATFKFTISRS